MYSRVSLNARSFELPGKAAAELPHSMVDSLQYFAQHAAPLQIISIPSQELVVGGGGQPRSSAVGGFVGLGDTCARVGNIGNGSVRGVGGTNAGEVVYNG